MAITLSALMAMAPADRISYCHDTMVQSELTSWRQAAAAADVPGQTLAIQDAVLGAEAVAATAAKAAATAAFNSSMATYYARIAAG